MNRTESLEHAVRELIQALHQVLLHGTMPEEVERMAWVTESEANHELECLGLPKVERPEGFQ